MYLRRLAFIFFAIIVLIILFVLIFGDSKNRPNKTTTTTKKPLTLPQYADTTAYVSLTTDGIVNGDDLHRAIRVIVNSTTREVDIYQGYSGHVLSFQTFSNTTQAYSVFLKALNNEGFMAKTTATKSPASETGQCPLGFRYIFDLNQDNNDILRTWSSTCSTGTAGGVVGDLLQLFQNQIPNYSTITGEVNLSATGTE